MSNLSIQTPRIIALDVVRGMAVVGMIIYHVWYQCIDQLVCSSAQGWWTEFFFLIGRSSAVMFLLLVGTSLYLFMINKREYSWWQKLKVVLLRSQWIAGCAVGITALTWVLFPQTMVWFGILHLVYVSRLVGVGLVSSRLARVVSMVLIFLMWWVIWFTSPLYAWWLVPLGVLPPGTGSFDYWPAVPWLLLPIMGIEGASWFSAGLISGKRVVLYKSGIVRSMAWLGQNALTLYIVHIPLIWLVFFIFSGILR